MTQEEKQLLLQDLCGRLPYKPKIQWDCADYDLLALENCEPLLARIIDDSPYSYAISKPLDEIKPYLRPMSSMTEEEVDEFTQFDVYSESEYIMPNYDAIDWLNKKMFDYHGLIEKGLAIEAPEEMYYSV